MALLMPDINLRRDRRHLERHWRRVLRGDSADCPTGQPKTRRRARRRAPDAISPPAAEPQPEPQPDMELGTSSALAVDAGDAKSLDAPKCGRSAAKSVTSNQDTEDEDEGEIHEEHGVPEEVPASRGDAAVDAPGHDQLRSVDGSGRCEHHTRLETQPAVSATRPPVSLTRPPRPPPSSSSSSACSSAPVAPHAVVTVLATSESAPRSKRRGGSGRGIRSSHPTTPPTSNSKFVSRVEGPTLGAIMQRVHVNDGDVCELDFSALAQRNKRLESVGCALVARSLSTNHTVRKLVIRDHAIGDDGAVALAKMLCNNTTLQCLDLYGNGIGDRGAEALAEALYGHDSLTHLFLWSNLITDRGAAALAQAVRYNCTLKYLGLVHNRITRVGGQAFLDALDVNFNLESLNLSTNEVPKSVANLISAALMRNRAEAPMLHSQMMEEEAEMTRRFAEMSDYADEEDEEGADEYWEDDGDDTESSGFLTCSGVTDIPLSSSGLWI